VFASLASVLEFGFVFSSKIQGRRTRVGMLSIDLLSIKPSCYVCEVGYVALIQVICKVNNYGL